MYRFAGIQKEGEAFFFIIYLFKATYPVGKVNFGQQFVWINIKQRVWYFNNRADNCSAKMDYRRGHVTRSNSEIKMVI